jgi:hypothetical protein
MRHRPLLLLFAAALFSAPLAAQPSGAQVIDTAMNAYASMLEGVDSYLLTMETFGFEHTTYFQRVEGGGPFDFEAFSVTSEGLQGLDDDTIPGFTPHGDMLSRMREQARYLEVRTINGRQVHAVEIEDIGAVMDGMVQTPPDSEMDIDSAVYLVGVEDGILYGVDIHGTAHHDGQASPVTMEMRMKDFRDVGPMRYPHTTTMRMTGFDAEVSAADREEARRELAEARRQFEQLPAEQRRMMERMMGDQLQQLERMLDGEAMEFEMRVTDLQVNVPAPR